MKISYRTGDMFKQLPEDKKIGIPHCCNNRGAWGAGFVIPLGRKFPRAQQDYLEWSRGSAALDHYFGPFMLGNTQSVVVDNVTVFNMVGQDGTVSPNNPKPVKYAAIADCLRKVNTTCLGTSIEEIHAPAFGSDLAGGDWRVLEALVDELLTAPKHVYIYTLTRDQQKNLFQQLQWWPEYEKHIRRANIRDNASYEYTWEDEDNNRCLTFDVYGHISKYVPAQTYGPPENCYPAEGGELEDWYSNLIEAEFYDDEGEVVRTLDQLHPVEIMALEQEFDLKVSTNDVIYQTLQEHMFDQASEPPDYD